MYNFSQIFENTIEQYLILQQGGITTIDHVCIIMAILSHLLKHVHHCFRGSSCLADSFSSVNIL